MSEIIWVDDSGNEIFWEATDGHGIFWSEQQQFPFTPSNFPPGSLTTLQKIIKAYLYVQYNDDDDLQGFVEAYNTLAQSYLEFANQLSLPIYTSPSVSGSLLDWVAAGLYGITRPSLPSGLTTQVGAFNTYAFNTIPINGLTAASVAQYYVTDDDTFRRIMTWSLFTGDGRVFDVRWLKRRVMRFLFGVNGVNFNVDQTYRVSVVFGGGNQVTVRVLKNQRTITQGPFNTYAFNTLPIGGINSSNVVFPSIPEAPILKAAIEAGALPVPFQYSVSIET
jgi:hypothetical protein